MVDGTKKNQYEISDKTSRMYYLVWDDNKPEGVATSLVSAQICAEVLARKMCARKIDSDLFVYEDDLGRHFITVSAVKKLKPTR